MDITNFISPKQLIKIKSDIAEEAIIRANPIIAIDYKDGIMVIAENPTKTLFKITELYDRIVFAGTGVYNDYEKLRKSGVQYADVKGFTYSRIDVKAKSIAGEYSRILGDIFSTQNTPLEVEILVLELSDSNEDNRMYYIPYTGSIIEEKKFAVIGDIYKEPDSDVKKKNILRDHLAKLDNIGNLDMKQTFRLLRESLSKVKTNGDNIPPENIELVVLERKIVKDRKFRRVSLNEMKAMLG
jgi:proteasome alpha subunit